MLTTRYGILVRGKGTTPPIHPQKTHTHTRAPHTPHTHHTAHSRHTPHTAKIPHTPHTQAKSVCMYMHMHRFDELLFSSTSPDYLPFILSPPDRSFYSPLTSHFPCLHFAPRALSFLACFPSILVFPFFSFPFHLWQHRVWDQRKRHIRQG